MFGTIGPQLSIAQLLFPDHTTTPVFVIYQVPYKDETHPLDHVRCDPE